MEIPTKNSDAIDQPSMRNMKPKNILILERIFFHQTLKSQFWELSSPYGISDNDNDALRKMISSL